MPTEETDRTQRSSEEVWQKEWYRHPWCMGGPGPQGVDWQEAWVIQTESHYWKRRVLEAICMDSGQQQHQQLGLWPHVGSDLVATVWLLKPLLALYQNTSPGYPLSIQLCRDLGRQQYWVGGGRGKGSSKVYVKVKLISHCLPKSLQISPYITLYQFCIHHALATTHVVCQSVAEEGPLTETSYSFLVYLAMRN